MIRMKIRGCNDLTRANSPERLYEQVKTRAKSYEVWKKYGDTHTGRVISTIKCLEDKVEYYVDDFYDIGIVSVLAKSCKDLTFVSDKVYIKGVFQYNSEEFIAGGEKLFIEYKGKVYTGLDGLKEYEKLAQKDLWNIWTGYMYDSFGYYPHDDAYIVDKGRLIELMQLSVEHSKDYVSNFSRSARSFSHNINSICVDIMNEYNPVDFNMLESVISALTLSRKSDEVYDTAIKLLISQSDRVKNEMKEKYDDYIHGGYRNSEIYGMLVNFYKNLMSVFREETINIVVRIVKDEVNEYDCDLETLYNVCSKHMNEMGVGDGKGYYPDKLKEVRSYKNRLDNSILECRTSCFKYATCETIDKELKSILGVEKIK